MSLGVTVGVVLIASGLKAFPSTFSDDFLALRAICLKF